MNFKRLSLALAGVVIAGTSLAAQAPAPGTQTATPKREAHMEKRADRQQKRIAEGVATGKLTPRETARLERQETKVNKDIAKAEADGKVTKKEAAKIEREQNKASKKIYKKKHNEKHQ
jgi:predicted transglutaminase-like cysteine proteinase